MSITINGTTGISGVDGSSTTPAFQGTDTNTGLFYGTDIVGISTGGSERVRVDASGNVGIGTTSPTQALTVNGRLAFSNLFAASNIDGIFLQSGVGTTVNTATGNNITFNTGTTERMRIDSSGNLLFNSGYGSVATAYGCRAWVNFNGTGTVAIRSSGNVTSITDGGVGNYTINFSTAMPDTNYATTLTCSGESRANSARCPTIATTGSTSAITMDIYNPAASSFQDAVVVMAAIFR